MRIEVELYELKKMLEWYETLMTKNRHSKHDSMTEHRIYMKYKLKAYNQEHEAKEDVVDGEVS